MSPKSFRKESYRNPYGVRPPRTPGMGRGKRPDTNEPSRAREVPSGTTLTQQSTDAWAVVTSELYRTLHRSAITFWIGHCELVGEHNGALVIAGLEQRAEWVRKRYAKHIGKVVRQHTDYRGLKVCDT